MTNKAYLGIFAAAALALTACGGDKPEPPTPTPTPGDGSVEVTISTGTIETKANALTDFNQIGKMNIFAKTTKMIDAPSIVDGVVATYQGGSWTMSPAVRIKEGQNAFIYAVAPYDASYTDPKAIPVDLSRQVDLLYSGSYVPASFTSPAIKLKMKHALALATFNIVPVNYSGAGRLTEMALDGDIVNTRGTMDVSTGKITVTGREPFTVKVDRTLQPGGFTSDIPGIWALPFNTKTGDVTLTLTIDGKKYQVLLPEVEMKTGYQFIFRLVLTDNGLLCDPSKTERFSLNVDADDEQTFAGYGQIVLTASGPQLTVPYMTGDAVFGNVVAGSARQAYEPKSTVSGLAAGNTVLVETWNSSGFSIESCEGIELIDLTDYE